MNPRWAVKRGLKWAVEWGMACSGLGFLYRMRPGFRHAFRILTYHRISEHPSDSHGLSIAHFKQQLGFLADNYPVVDLHELTTKLISGSCPPKDSIALTFDDGYRECGSVVREVLERHRLPATFFVVTGILDGEVPICNNAYLNWDEVKQLHTAGFAIGSHSRRHVSLGELDLSTVQGDLTTSWSRIREELGTPPSGLAYPYGTMRDFSPCVAEIARQVGYHYAITAIHGLNHAYCDPFTLKRTSITAGDGLRTFRMILNGNLDPWALVDRFAYRFQRSHTE